MLSAAGHGVRSEVEEVGQLAIAAAAQFERFQSGIQAALLLVQQAVEQEDGGFQFLFGDLQHGGIYHGGDSFDGAARNELPPLDGPIQGSVQVQTGDDLAGNSTLLDQLMQCVLYFDVQRTSQSSAKYPRGE